MIWHRVRLVTVGVAVLLGVCSPASGPASGASIDVSSGPARQLAVIAPGTVPGTDIPPAATLLKVNTDSPSSITSTSARLNGHLVQLGTGGSANVSFQWGTSSNASSASETEVQQRNTTGTYYSVVVGLSTSTTYWYRARAVGEGEEDLGSWEPFTTLSGPPPPDTTPPAAVSNLATTSPTQTSITLTWTAPGDDAASGTAATYDIRYSTSTINEGNWATATQASGEPSPAIAGTGESFAVPGLSANTTYYFAIKTADEAPNWSAISNSPSGTTLAVPPPPPDTTPPAAVTNLATTSPTQTAITLTWTAPGDDGLSGGTAATYDIRYSTSTINEGNWATATQASGEPNPRIAGTGESFAVPGLIPNTTYYFAIKTADEAPNWSAISNSPSGTTSASPPPPDTTPPAAVTNLATTSPTQTAITLTWTAPGDDGLSGGTAATYDIRYSTSTINEGNWATATQASGEPNPRIAGTGESFAVPGLSPSTTYYFAIKAADEAPNWSAISNSPTATTLQVVSPPPPPVGGGGGGGSGGAAPPGPGVTSLSPYINDAGVFTLAAVAASDDTKVRLTIAQGVQARAKDGGPLKSASINRLDNPPPPPPDARMVGLAYELGPDGATFAPPITLTFAFDPSQLPPGFPATDVVIATWDAAGKAWLPLDGVSVDAARSTVSARLSHFSQFAVIARSRPAFFSVSNLILSPPQIKTGDTVSVTAQVMNSGDLAGSYPVTLKINGAVQSTQSVNLSGNSKDTVTFTITGDAPGTYVVELGGLSGELVISSPERPATFSLASLTVSPREVDVGEGATISVIVSNTGDVTGTYTVTLMVDGSARESLQVILGPHTTRSVALTASELASGSHAVAVGSESGVLVVKAPAAATAAVRLVNWYVVALLIFALTAVASAFGFRMNARRSFAPPGPGQAR